MGDTIEVMGIELEQKDTKTEFLENKIGLPASKNIEEMNKIRLNKIPSKRKTDKIMDRLNVSPNNHKYKRNTKQ